MICPTCLEFRRLLIDYGAYPSLTRQIVADWRRHELDAHKLGLPWLRYPWSELVEIRFVGCN